MRTTPQYSKIEIWTGSDPVVRALSFEAKGMFHQLMSFPLMSKVPGLIVDVGPLGFCDKWNISLEKFESLFGELLKAEIVEVDWENRLVLVPWMLSRMVSNRPRSLSQAVCWGGVIFLTTPECPLRQRADQYLRALMLDNPSLMQSYLEVRTVTNKDVERLKAEGRPTRTPQQQPQQQLRLRMEGQAELAAAEPQAPTEAAQEPAEVDADGALEEGMQLLQDTAGLVFTDVQMAKLRMQWQEAFALGWRSKDLADLGSSIARGDFHGLHSPIPAWVAKDLGRALKKMQEHAAQRGPMPPPRRRAAAGEGKRELKWHTSRGRLCGVSDGPEKSDMVRADYDWEVEVLTAFHERWKKKEDFSLAEIRAALVRPPDTGIDDVADHDLPANVDELRRDGTNG